MGRLKGFKRLLEIVDYLSSPLFPVSLNTPTASLPLQSSAPSSSSFPSSSSSSSSSSSLKNPIFSTDIPSTEHSSEVRTRTTERSSVISQIFSMLRTYLIILPVDFVRSDSFLTHPSGGEFRNLKVQDPSQIILSREKEIMLKNKGKENKGLNKSKGESAIKTGSITSNRESGQNGDEKGKECDAEVGTQTPTKKKSTDNSASVTTLSESSSGIAQSALNASPTALYLTVPQSPPSSPSHSLSLSLSLAAVTDTYCTAPHSPHTPPSMHAHNTPISPTHTFSHSSQSPIRTTFVSTLTHTNGSPPATLNALTVPSVRTDTIVRSSSHWEDIDLNSSPSKIKKGNTFPHINSNLDLDSGLDSRIGSGSTSSEHSAQHFGLLAAADRDGIVLNAQKNDKNEIGEEVEERGFRLYPPKSTIGDGGTTNDDQVEFEVDINLNDENDNANDLLLFPFDSIMLPRDLLKKEEERVWKIMDCMKKERLNRNLENISSSSSQQILGGVSTEHVHAHEGAYSTSVSYVLRDQMLKQVR